MRTPSRAEALGGGRAVCSLWHFPWSRLHWPLASTLALRSPDFPLASPLPPEGARDCQRTPGPRLALQWFSSVSIRYSPFQALDGRKPARNGIFRRCLASYCVSIGRFARLLLTIVMVAVSQAPSPDSNPNPPLPVKGSVVHYTTDCLIGREFIQQRAI